MRHLRRDYREAERAVVAAHDVKARAAGPPVGAQLDARDAEQPPTGVQTQTTI